MRRCWWSWTVRERGRDLFLLMLDSPRIAGAWVGRQSWWQPLRRVRNWLIGIPMFAIALLFFLPLSVFRIAVVADPDLSGVPVAVRIPLAAVAITVLGLPLLCCVAHGWRGWGLFGILALPGALTTMLDELFHVPYAVTMLFMGFALLVAWQEDHPDVGDVDAAVET